MCGRFSINKAITPIISELFNVDFSAEENFNVSPSQSISTIIKGKLNNSHESNYSQINALWGIKPTWSKKLIINAQAETVATKPTFKQAFQTQRCLVPCNGWFEWRTEEGKKVKYFFEHANKMPLYMAGILFQHEQTELVTLTTEPNNTCSPYHKRMPALVLARDKDDWFNSPVQELETLLRPVQDKVINVSLSNSIQAARPKKDEQV
ncbi:MAG: SOS response-associated peptidase [Alteromonadaceae bacterium TMED7]|nr:MAG: SOS response-associated peptidase [Alteromonadaceae bacterium TMED7]|tara:strand:+ start:30279 stop:30902 length:624 start_codon:yes stop_codon:yes gene_type:complete